MLNVTKHLAQIFSETLLSFRMTATVHEQRITSRLINYWESIKGQDQIPPYAKINPGNLEELWHNCLALKAEPGAAGETLYVYTHCGPEIAKAIGQNLTGKRMSANMKFLPGAKILKRIDEVTALTPPSPLLDEGQFVNDKNQIIKYRACLLAFGMPGSISHVVAGVSWRAF